MPISSENPFAHPGLPPEPEQSEVERLQLQLESWQQREAFLLKGLETTRKEIEKLLGQLGLQGIEVDCPVEGRPIYPYEP